MFISETKLKQLFRDAPSATIIPSIQQHLHHNQSIAQLSWFLSFCFGFVPIQMNLSKLWNWSRNLVLFVFFLHVLLFDHLLGSKFSIMIINSPEKILPSPYQIVQLKFTTIIIILWEFFFVFHLPDPATTNYSQKQIEYQI